MNNQTNQHLAHLIIHCPDKVGIIAAVTQFLKENHANIVDLDQHTSIDSGGEFFMRLAFEFDGAGINLKQFEQEFVKRVGTVFKAQYKLTLASTKKRMAIMVSKHDHALLEILWRVKRGQLAIDVPLIISNHADLQKEVENFGIPFHHIPVTPDTKSQAEEAALKLLEGKVDGIVLARYMQILSSEFVANFKGKIINIHHSFLPAFKGADPYQQAFDKGVKIIGATAHFVTNELDEGPIIAQDIVKVSHRHDVAELRELGRDIERNVLARAVKYFAQDRIILDKHKTVVFE